MSANANALETALRRLVTDLNAIGARWALVGGLAVSVRAEPRTTRDVDVAVAVADDGEAEHLVHRLQSCGYRLQATVEHDRSGRLATARLEPAEGGGVLADLLFASSGIEPEVVAGADDLEILPRLSAPVASVGHLLALKVLARDDRTRPQDLDDIRALLREVTAADIEVARSSLQLIESRGFERGRRLLAQFEAILAEMAPRA